MVYSLTTGEKNGIIQVCEDLTNLGDAAISGNSSLLAQFTRFCNMAYDQVAAEILQNEGDWEWDDTNYTNFPIATKNLVASQRDYALPAATSGGDASTFLRLDRVQVMDTSGRYQNINKIDEVSFIQQPLDTLYNNNGFPLWYRPVGNSIELYPATDSSFATLTNGLRIYFERQQILFLTTDTTKQPGFPALYHELIPIMASEWYAALNKLDSLGFIQQKKQEFLKNLGWNMANRFKDQRQRIIPVQSRRNPNYE